MAERKKIESDGTGWRVGKRSGLFRATFRITGEQLDALREEAGRRAAKRGAVQGDTSEIVREALAGWLKKRK